MRSAKVWLCLAVVVGCGDRIQIGRDDLDGGATGTGGSGGQVDAASTTGAGGSGGQVDAASTTGAGGSGGQVDAASTTGAGGSGGQVDAASTTGAGGSGGQVDAASTTGTGGSGGQVDAGTGTGGASGSGGSVDGGLPPWPDPNACSGTSPITGVWTGYVENFMFPSGSDAIRVDIHGADASTLCGTVTYGVGTIPPPATDPNVGYPVGEVFFDMGMSSLRLPHEGFPHALSSGVVAGKRVRFQSIGTEPWKGWCALQTSYATGGGYRCLPGEGGSSSTGPDGKQQCAIQITQTEHLEVDCNKWALCSFQQVCACDGVRCQANITEIRQMSFDAQFDAADAKGTIKMDGTLYNVYLTKSP